MKIKAISKIIYYLYRFPDIIIPNKFNAFILMFHHVTNEKTDASKPCFCTVEHFRKILIFLQKNNINVISIDDAFKLIRQKVFKGYAVITFDDGFEDTIKVSYPILKEFNFPFVIYVTVNYLNKKGFLTTEQLNILNQDSLCTIGSHSMSHKVLRTDPNSKYEIVQSKKLLESMINEQIKHFAFPYGGPGTVSCKNISELKSSGYMTAVSSIGSYINLISSINHFYLPRINGSFYHPWLKFK